MKQSSRNPAEATEQVIGWREWIGLPDLLPKRVKAKVDTGARSSSLHASNVETFEKHGEVYARFDIHPYHRNPDKRVAVEAKIIEFRTVRSSSGQASSRPVIVTNIRLLGKVWPVELTLANRDQMGFRMLLGREAFRGRFLVDAGRSYFGGKPKRRSSRRKDSK